MTRAPQHIIAMLVALAGSGATPASAQCEGSWFMQQNGGALGGALYFDVAPWVGLDVDSLETNFDAPVGTSVGMLVYAKRGSFFGHETDAAAWQLIGRDDGSAVAAGVDNPTRIRLICPFRLDAQLWGIALVAVNSGHRYSNGFDPAGSVPGINLTLYEGSASNVPFEGPTFQPRGWNGKLCFQPAASLGTSYCATLANSTGAAAELALLGSASLQQNLLCAWATGLPPREFGFLLVAQRPGSTNLAAAGLGDGVLCLGAGVGRLTGLLQSSGPLGIQTGPIDLLALPQANAPYQFSAGVGQTLHFQGWFRDGSGTFGNNLTDGVSVLVTP